MDEPLWIDEHAPSLADLPQASVRDRLRDAVDEPVNLVVYGPSGAGRPPPFARSQRPPTTIRRRISWR